GINLCRQSAFILPLATGLARLAWILQATGDPAGAREAIREAERVAPSPAVAVLVNPVPAQWARLLLTQGDVAGAARWTQQHGLSPDDEPSYPQEREYLVLARVLLARLLALAAAQGRTGSVIEVGALRALALAARGEQRAAVTALAEVLTLAWPQGYVRVFADEGAPMRALLGLLTAAYRTGQSPAAVPQDYVAALLRACGKEYAALPWRPAGAPAGLAGSLTDRELEVLRLLAAGQSNQRIAHDLVVTLDTVKKHVSHIMGKLGAANRTEAVARARQVGLIP